MRKINNLWGIGIILIIIGCATPTPETKILYQTYLNACPTPLKITAYDIDYHGEITVDSKTYHFLGYSYAWEVVPENYRGNGQILVFDSKYNFIGYFSVYGDPEVLITGNKMDLYFPDETKQNQRTYYDFSNGIPDTDMNNFGFDYLTKDEINKLRT
jgi:hypothetical protein